MATPKKQSAAEQIEQLNMLAKAYTGGVTFKPGDLVLRRDETFPVQARGRDVRNVAVVIETVDCLRNFMGDKSLFPGQGLLICCTNESGDFQMGWLGAWQYRPAPPDLIASFIGQTTH